MDGRDQRACARAQDGWRRRTGCRNAPPRPRRTSVLRIQIEFSSLQDGAAGFVRRLRETGSEPVRHDELTGLEIA